MTSAEHRARGDTRRLDITTPSELAGERVDRVLAAVLPELSRSRVKALIDAGCLSSGSATIAEASYRVKPGQPLTLLLPPPVPAAPAAQVMDLRIVHEDAAVIVVDKPPGMVVHPAPGNPDRTLVNALIAHCGDNLLGIGGERRPGIVHRLDKDTSGLLVAAKTQAAHAGLVRQFAGREIERVYLAVVWGVPAPATGELRGNIGRSTRDRKKMAVLPDGGRPAMTRYKVVRVLAGGAAALVECRLLTGRTHQIRVHMAEAGHPLIGDPLYGRTRAKWLRRLPEAGRTTVERFGRQALHAATLGFRHPESGRLLRFEAPPPADFQTLCSALADVTA